MTPEQLKIILDGRLVGTLGALSAVRETLGRRESWPKILDAIGDWLDSVADLGCGSGRDVGAELAYSRPDGDAAVGCAVYVAGQLPAVLVEAALPAAIAADRALMERIDAIISADGDGAGVVV